MGRKRDRIKQVQVQEKIIHKKRLQYFIGRGAEVRYSPLLWPKKKKKVHHICQQARIVHSKIQLTSCCCDSAGLIRTFWVADRRRTSRVAGCRHPGPPPFTPLQGLMGAEDVAPMSGTMSSSPPRVVHQFLVVRTVTGAKKKNKSD